MSEKLPTCEHWILGNITVQEGDRLQEYERSILVSFKTVEDYRKALKFVTPLLDKDAQ